MTLGPEAGKPAQHEGLVLHQLGRGMHLEDVPRLYRRTYKGSPWPALDWQ